MCFWSQNATTGPDAPFFLLVVEFLKADGRIGDVVNGFLRSALLVFLLVWFWFLEWSSRLGGGVVALVVLCQPEYLTMAYFAART